MAMFTAYFDASGNPDNQPFVVVAGYVANFIQWRVFEDTWKRAHDSYDAQLPFHMSSFMSAVTNPQYESQSNVRPDYVALAKDTKKATDFFTRLCIAEQTLTTCGFSCIIDMRIYEGISSLLDLRKVVPPYALAARICIAEVHKWQEFVRVDEPVEIILEQGDFEQGKLTELIVDEGGDLPSYKRKQDFAGLQAADHYAWEQFHQLKRELRGEYSSARTSFAFLLNAIPKRHSEVTAEGLIRLCQDKRIDPRTGIRS